LTLKQSVHITELTIAHLMAATVATTVQVYFFQVADALPPHNGSNADPSDCGIKNLNMPRTPELEVLLRRLRGGA
jgi:hypothetical protein